MNQVLVIGSSNTDMVIRVADLPRPGETVSGNEFRVFAGGKGANQAVAAKRADSAVIFLTAVGDDDFGNAAVATYAAEGIDVSSVQVIPATASGVAMIFVNDAGENCIGVAAGANAALLPTTIAGQRHVFDAADVLLMQLETPIETVAAALQLSSRCNLRAILNPAPAAPLSDEIMDGLFCITPNETEAEALTGVDVSDINSAQEAAQILLDLGVQNVVITMGAKGALLVNAEGSYHQETQAVSVVDTTGAGDTFNGVLAAMIAKGLSLQDAMRPAVNAASLSVQSAGAIASIPTLDQYD